MSGGEPSSIKRFSSLCREDACPEPENGTAHAIPFEKEVYGLILCLAFLP